MERAAVGGAVAGEVYAPLVVRVIPLVVFALLPIQWVLVRLPPLGQQRLHIAVLLVAIVVALPYLRWWDLRAYLSVTWPFVTSMGALILLWIVTNFFHGISMREGIRQAIQLLILVLVGTILFQALRDTRGVNLLRWTALTANLVLFLGLGVAMRLNGIDPFAVFRDAIVHSDPIGLSRTLYKTGLAGFGYEPAELLTNVRHEIFAAVVVSTYLSVITQKMSPLRSTPARWLFRFSIAVSVVLVVFSLSRSLSLAALMWPVLTVVRAVQLGQLRRSHIAVGVLSVVAVVVAVSTGFVNLLSARYLEDTRSYEKRDVLVGEAFDNIGRHLLTGGTTTEGASSHNVILDSWLRTGFGGVVTALIATLVLIGLWVTLVVRLRWEPDWIVPTVSCLGLVLVRMFTAGGGAIPAVEWVALAVVGAVMTFYLRGQPPPDSSTDPSSVPVALSATGDRVLIGPAGSPT